MAFYTYILRGADGSYFVGCTDDLNQRLAEQACQEYLPASPGHVPVALVWCASYTNFRDAFAVKRKLKGWERTKTDALMRGDWELVRELAQGLGTQVAPPGRGTPSASTRR